MFAIPVLISIREKLLNSLLFKHHYPLKVLSSTISCSEGTFVRVDRDPDEAPIANELGHCLQNRFRKGL